MVLDGVKILEGVKLIIQLHLVWCTNKQVCLIQSLDILIPLDQQKHLEYITVIKNRTK